MVLLLGNVPLQTPNLLLIFTNLFMTGSVDVVFENLGFMDFRPSGDVGVLFLNEAELIRGTNYKQRIIKLAKVRLYGEDMVKAWLGYGFTSNDIPSFICINTFRSKPFEDLCFMKRLQ